MGQVAVGEWLDSSGNVDLRRFKLLSEANISGREVADKLAVIRESGELNELKKRIVHFARIFSSNYQIKVLPSDDGRWSVAIDPEALKLVDELNAGKRSTLLDLPVEKFTPHAILYNLDDVALAPEEQVLTKLRHEALRARNIDYRLIFEGQKLARDAGDSPGTFGIVQLALDDARLYQKDTGASQAAREKLAEVLGAEQRELSEKIGQQPLEQQFAMNLVYGYWLHGQPVRGVDQRIVELTEKLAPAIEKYISGSSNLENFKLLREVVWPEVRELEKLGIKDEVKRLVIREIAGDYQEQLQRESKISYRLTARLRRMLRLKPKAPDLTPDESELKSVVDQYGGDSVRAAFSAAYSEQQRSNALGKSAQRNGLEPTLRDDFDLARLSAEDAATLDAITEKLPAVLRESFYSSAVRRSGQHNTESFRRGLPVGLETSNSEKNGSGTVNFAASADPADIHDREGALERVARELGLFGPESQQDELRVLTQEEVERGEKDSALAIRQQLVQRELKRGGFTPEEMKQYENFKRLENSVIGGLDDFLADLRPELPKKRGYAFGTQLYYTGTKLDRRSLGKRIPTNDLRIYRRLEPIDTPDPRMFVELLIDNSGSMRGPKMDESVKTAIFWARALKEMNVPFAIKLFGTQVIELKKFDDDYDDALVRIKPRLVQLTDASMKKTDLGSALNVAAEGMEQAKRAYPESFGAIFVISDSGANQGLMKRPLQSRIREIQKDFVVMNFILSQDERQIREAQAYFGRRNTVAPSGFIDLPGDSIRALRGVLREAFKTGGGIRY